jgi:opacity protein-like surface antigen
MKTLKLMAGVTLVLLVISAAPVAAQTGMTWAGSLYAGFAKATEDGAPDGSIGFRGNVMAMVHPVIGLGPEVGYHMLGSQKFTTADPNPSNPGGRLDFDTDFKVLQATAQVMARGQRGTVHPFATGGMGLYSMKTNASVEEFNSGGTSLGTASADDTQSKFGFNLGGGLQYKPGTSSMGFGAEFRWHSIQTEGSSTDMLTVMAGVNFN